MMNVNITKEDIINELKWSGQLPKIIDQVVDRQILATAISKLKIVITDEELQVAADHFRAVNSLHTAHETMLWLRENSLNVQDLELIAGSFLGAQKLARKLFPSTSVEKHFFENKLNYSSIVMYEILLNDQDVAIEVFYAIQEGELTFPEAASKYITDPEIRRSGGYIGIINRSSLLPEVSAAVAMAKPPQLIKPVFTGRGTHLIFVEEIIEPQLNPKMQEMILADMLFQWLNQQKSELDIIKSF